MPGYDTHAPLETLRQVICDGLSGLLAVAGIARPGVDVDDHRFAVFLDDGIAAKNFQSQRGRGPERRVAQALGLEAMTQHSLVTMIEPFEPIGSHRTHFASDTVKFDQVARDVLLRDDERNAAFGKPVQGLMPPRFGRSVNYIGRLRRVEIITLDPHGGRGRRSFCVARNDVARR